MARHTHDTQAHLLGQEITKEEQKREEKRRRELREKTQEERKRHKRAVIGFAIAAALVIAGVVALFVIDPPLYFVTINGRKELVTKNVSISRIIEDGKAEPVPGDLIAIDGSIAVEGGGEPFAATVDGAQTTDPETVLVRGAVLEIGDGADVDETFTEGEESIPAGLDDYDPGWSSYYNGALHLYTHGSEGRAHFKLGDVSGIKITEVLEENVPSTYTITNAPGMSRAIALTFDDGPWAETTSQILDVLEKEHARATFFTIGSQIADHAEVVRRAHDLGCQIATHTWDHASGSGGGTNIVSMSPEEQVAEVVDGLAAIEEATGEEPSRVMRAPGGNFFGDAVENLEPHIDAEIGWNVDTYDWDQPGAEAIYQAILSAQGGQVVLLHDGGGDRSQTVEAVRRAVPELIKRGFRLVTIDELLEYV